MVARPNNPIDKVRELQRRLYIAAKRNQERRFHALYDRIWRSDVLLEAWKLVRSNKGAAGIDGLTLAMIEQQGVAAVTTLSERSSDCATRSPVNCNHHLALLGQYRRLGIGTWSARL